MTTRELPPHPNLDQYKKQAKDLLKACKSGDSEAIRRLSECPRPRKQSNVEIVSDKYRLSDAQFVIAREHGFESWPKFAKHIEALTRQSSADSVWESAKNAVINGDPSTLERLLRENPELFRDHRPPPYGSQPGSLAPDYSEADARSIIARNHQFENWEEFAQYQQAVTRKNSPVAQFEAAVEAIVEGDLSTLERLLRENPELIRARSMRKHHSTLLHYVGANGVEDFRQKTPKNAVKIAQVLLTAGADADATADMYGGGSTTFGLVATSIHPLLTGVQNELLATLIDHGAAIGPGAVNDCLANGRGSAAEFLARHGAPLDLEGAAGVGRLDVVKTFFNEDGSLRPNATPTQMKDGFAWACEFGRTSVVDFLLQKGIAVNARLKHHGQTGLHWAACGAHVDTVKLLLERKAPIDAKDEAFGGTPLRWALYGWGEHIAGNKRDDYYKVVALLVAAGASVELQWLNEENPRTPLDQNVQSDPRMRAALRGEIPR